MNSLDVLGLESSAQGDGVPTWSARWFCSALGYTDWKTFQKVIDKSIRTCASSGIDTLEHFRKDGNDITLSRFALYVIAMSADSRKEEVAKAQVYLAGLATAVTEYVESEGVDRLIIRDDLRIEEKNLSATAKAHYVQNFPLFHNAGYRGMYNMNMKQLKERRRIPEDRSVLDFMYSEELAANLFRVTQTGAKIRKEGVVGQNALENAAIEVGRTVRRTMVTAPEALPTASDIKGLRTNLRLTQRVMKKLDAASEGD